MMLIGLRYESEYADTLKKQILIHTGVTSVTYVAMMSALIVLMKVEFRI